MHFAWLHSKPCSSFSVFRPLPLFLCKIMFVYGHFWLWSCLSVYDRVCLSSYSSVYYPCLLLPAWFLTAAALLPVQDPFRITAEPLEKANIKDVALIFAITLKFKGFFFLDEKKDTFILMVAFMLNILWQCLQFNTKFSYKKTNTVFILPKVMMQWSWSINDQVWHTYVEIRHQTYWLWLWRL